MPSSTYRPFTLAVVGARSGVGTSTTAFELSAALANRGSNVYLLDLAGPNLGLSRRYGLSTQTTPVPWTHSETDLGLDLFALPCEVKLLSGREQTAESVFHAGGVLEEIQRMDPSVDYLLIDTPAGINQTTIDLLKASEWMLLVITPEPACLTDAFSLLRVLHANGGKPRIEVLTNKVIDQIAGDAIFRRFHSLASPYLPEGIHHFGSLSRDNEILMSDRPLIEFEDSTELHDRVLEFATTLESLRNESVVENEAPDFWGFLDEQPVDQTDPLLAKQSIDGDEPIHVALQADELVSDFDQLDVHELDTESQVEIEDEIEVAVAQPERPLSYADRTLSGLQAAVFAAAELGRRGM